MKSYHDETPDRPQDKYYYPKSEIYNCPCSENDDRNDNNNVSGPVGFRQQGKTNLEYDYPPSEGSQGNSYDYPRPQRFSNSGSVVSKEQDAGVDGLESIVETEGEADTRDGDGYLKPASTDEHGYLKPVDSNKADTYLTVVPSTLSDQVDGNTKKVKGFSRIVEFFRRGITNSDETHSYDNAGNDRSRIRRMKQDENPHEYDNQIPGHKTSPVSK